MPLGDKLKSWLFPTLEERREHTAKEEVKRQARYERLSERQKHDLASLRRQESLAEGQLEIAERRRHIGECRAKAAGLQPSPSPQFAQIGNIGDKLDKLANEMYYGPKKQEQQTGKGDGDDYHAKN